MYDTTSSFAVFHQEVAHRTSPDWSTLDTLVQLAKDGEQHARNALIEWCLPAVIKLAYKFKPYLPHDDYSDVCGIGNLALVECLDDALSAHYPIGYLMRCAHHRICEYISCHSSLISTSKTSKALSVSSIDDDPVLQQTLAVSEKVPEDEYKDWVMEALVVLTPLERDVVLIKYGFPGRSVDSLYQLSKVRGVRGRYTASLKAALRKLRAYAAVA